MVSKKNRQRQNSRENTLTDVRLVIFSASSLLRMLRQFYLHHCFH